MVIAIKYYNKQLAVAIKQIKNSDIHICIFKILIFKHLQRSKNRYSVSI